MIFQADTILTTPVQPDKFSNFLRREREALLRRRAILTAKDTENGCKNATFTSENDILDAGFELSQCRKLSQNCVEDCVCEKVCDSQGQCEEKCSEIEECEDSGISEVIE